MISHLSRILLGLILTGCAALVMLLISLAFAHAGALAFVTAAIAVAWLIGTAVRQIAIGRLKGPKS